MRLQVIWRAGWAYVDGTGPDGARIRRALKTRHPRRAEEARANLEARLWKEGLYGPGVTVTFDEAALAYAKDGGDTRFLVKVSTELAGRRLRDITPRDVREAAKKLYPSAAPATLNRQAITPIRAVILYAHRQGWCPPIRVVGFPVKRATRKAVGMDYLDTLRPHLPHRLYVLMLFLHVTGRRIGDALAMEPSWRTGAVVRIPDTKNGEPATAHIPPAVAALLDDLPPVNGLVFGYAARSSVYATLRRACAKAGVEYLGTHQPGRHSYATTLHNAGYGSKAIADAGGWKSVRLVAEIYEHPNEIALAASRLFGAKSTQRKRQGGK